MKTSRTTIPLRDQDRKALAAIRDYYGLTSDVDAIRIAIHDVYRRIQQAKNGGKTHTSEDV